MPIEFPVGKPEAGKLLVEFSDEGGGERRTLPLPWLRLTETNALRPGSVVVIGGPPGFGKTLFCQQIALHLQLEKLLRPNRYETWYYLPLEDRKVDFQRRMLAMMEGDWKIIEGAKNNEDAEKLTEVFFDHDGVRWCDEHICENPRLPIERDGKVVVPPMPFKEVLEWVGKSFLLDQGWRGDKWVTRLPARVLFIDSLSFIDFGEPPWKGQRAFVNHLAGMTAQSGASVLIVAHTIKRPGAGRSFKLSGEDLAGAAELHRAAHCVILIDSHEPTLSMVHRAGGLVEEVEHNRTVIIDKCRWGKGLGERLAFRLRKPEFEELGVIMPKKRKEKKSCTPF